MTQIRSPTDRRPGFLTSAPTFRKEFTWECCRKAGGDKTAIRAFHVNVPGTGAIDGVRPVSAVLGRSGLFREDRNGSTPASQRRAEDFAESGRARSRNRVSEGRTSSLSWRPLCVRLSRSFPPFRKRSLSALLRHCFGTLTLPISPGPDIETEGLPLPARAPGPDQISPAGRGLWRDDCDGSRRRREGR